MTVSDYEVVDGNDYDVLCINYKVEKQFDDGACDRTLKNILLNKCSQGIATVKKDWTGLIESCQTTSGTAKSGSQLCQGRKYGVNIKASDPSFDFQLCLRDVFDSDYYFGNKIKFKTKIGTLKDNFVCTEDELSGLPCLDADKFNSGDYDNSGFNLPSTNNVMRADEMTHDAEFKTHSSPSVEKTIEWSLVAGLSAFFLVAAVVISLCFYRKKKIASEVTNDAMVKEVAMEKPNQAVAEDVVVETNVPVEEDVARTDAVSV